MFDTTHTVKPYSGSLSTLPLRNRSEEGVGARIDDSIEKYGPLEDMHVEETPYYNLRERRGWTRLSLWGEFGGVKVGLYACDEGACCDVADRDAFRRSVLEGRGFTKVST